MSLTFGPVPSRRLGRSLGIDLLPFKTCTHDCVYCQLGRTEALAFRRRRFRTAGAVAEAVARALAGCGGADTLTFSGSGEPTLELGLGEMIRTLKRRFSLPVAVITNGALLCRPEVREDLMAADMVLPSLDAWTEEMFRRINRPHPRLRLGRTLEGLTAFGKAFRGELWLEVLFVAGVNDAPQDLPGLLRWVERVRPGRIQINTVVRPPAEPWARAVPTDRLEEIRQALGPCAEIIAPFRGEAERVARAGLEDRVLEMVLRRPLTAADVVATLGIEAKGAEAFLDGMARRHGLVREQVGDRVYYRKQSA
jgi:wyosine [tRNA(Phe)-imidazoG37] synthetase (radical SAM superfamily)